MQRVVAKARRHSIMRLEKRRNYAGVAVLVIGVLLATAPVWRLWVFGFDPIIDRFLQSVIYGGPIR